MKRYNVVVLGAGPAGAEAAIMAHDLGLTTLVIDEARDAGGQIYRPSGVPSGGKGSPEGDALRHRLKASGAALAFEHRVWTMSAAAASEGGFEISAVGPANSLTIAADAVVIATGATERFYPRPGWTLPGAIGLGAATVMIKAQHILPGKRVLVVGPGPLAPLVASLILEYGGEVAAIVDPNHLGSWLTALPQMTSRPALLWDGLKWNAAFRRHGVPVLRGWDLRSIGGKEEVESATVGPVDDAWLPVDSQRSRNFEVDAVCMGYGLVPATEFCRLIGALLEYAPERGGWTPRLDAQQRTNIPHVYAAGDGAAVLGVAAAPLTGRIAALTAAFDLGRMEKSKYQDSIASIETEFVKVRRFGRVVAGMMQPHASAVKTVPDGVVVCRCEDVTAAELRAAIDKGSVEMNALKSATRCGMGPCGGRICSEAASAFMECAGLQRNAIGYWTARPPLRPIPLDALTGRFEYADIPIKEPAPL